MKTATKLASFAAVVAIGFGGAAAVGAVAAPIGVTGASDQMSHGGEAAASTDLPRGLAVAEAGYRLVVEQSVVAAGTPSRFGFSIVDDHGVAVTTFDQVHERALHLIVLSRNLVDYLHLHPVMDRSGRWSVDLPALTPGSYRVFADFQPTGAANLTLGTDIIVPGNQPTVRLPQPANVVTVDGYTVTMTGAPQVGEAQLTFTVETAGAIVHTDPYLGAAGHLVAIRSGDLAYLHVQPTIESTNPVVTFMGEFPTAGTYRLFFDFSHAGAVHTASFTVIVSEAASGTGNTMSMNQEGQ